MCSETISNGNSADELGITILIPALAGEGSGNETRNTVLGCCYHATTTAAGNSCKVKVYNSEAVTSLGKEIPALTCGMG